MKDLTHGSITRHLLQMSLYLAGSMIVQALYFLVDLYFVAGISKQALAGVSAAGNVAFIVMTATQIVGVSTVTMMSHAVGREDHPGANLVFNQSLSFATLCSAATLVLGYALAGPYMDSVSADSGMAKMGKIYLYWYIPGLVLQFVTISMGAALRGTGIVRPTMIVQIATVALNIILAPMLIAGWGTGYPLGVAGAALATTISIVLGTGLLLAYFMRLERYVFLEAALWRPHLPTWKRMLGIGIPAGGEYAVIFTIHCVVYWSIQPFGASAQAGYGVGSRIMQSIFVPAMAIALAAAPIAGQNFGALKPERVRETFRRTALFSSVIMAALTLLCQWAPDLLVRQFVDDPQVIVVGAEYLQIMSWNFVGISLVFTCSSCFWAIGNSWPTLISGVARMFVFITMVLVLISFTEVRLAYFWYLSVATIAFQAIVSLSLLAREFRRRLEFAPKEVVSL